MRGSETGEAKTSPPAFNRADTPMSRLTEQYTGLSSNAAAVVCCRPRLLDAVCWMGGGKLLAALFWQDCSASGPGKPPDAACLPCAPPGPGLLCRFSDIFLPPPKILRACVQCARSAHAIKVAQGGVLFVRRRHRITFKILSHLHIPSLKQRAAAESR